MGRVVVTLLSVLFIAFISRPDVHQGTEINLNLHKIRLELTMLWKPFGRRIITIPLFERCCVLWFVHNLISHNKRWKLQMVDSRSAVRQIRLNIK